MYSDAAFKNSDERIRSISGKLLLMRNEDGIENVIYAKSTTIKKICKSVKSSKTRSLEEGIEVALGIAKALEELMTGKRYNDKEEYVTCPIRCYIDSKTLYDSLHSTKQIQEQDLRVIIAWIKEKLQNKQIAEVNWGSTADMYADALTKEGVNTDTIQNLLTNDEKDENKVLMSEIVTNETTIKIDLNGKGEKHLKISRKTTMKELKPLFSNCSIWERKQI